MLVLHTKKQEEIDLQKALEESKQLAGLPNDFESIQIAQE